MIPFDDTNLAEYEEFLALNELMVVNSCGIKTHRDGVIIDFDENTLADRMRDISSECNLELLRQRYGITDTPNWKLKDAQLKVKTEDVRHFIRPIAYRPFDYRWIYYNPDIIEKGDSKYPTLRHMLRDNLALLSARIQATGTFDAVFVSKFLVEMKTAESSRSCTVSPLFLTDISDSGGPGVSNGGHKPNLNSRLIAFWAAQLEVGLQEATGMPDGMTPECIFHYVYAVLHSPAYRQRYDAFLRIDFPRVPIPGSLRMFNALARLGGQLVEWHLLEHPAALAIGGGPHPSTLPEGEGASPCWFGTDFDLQKVAEKSRALAVLSGDVGKVFINATSGFANVRLGTWQHTIGGYQVLHKWLNDRRKAGRSLSQDDITHWLRVYAALEATQKLMLQVDEAIEANGGWPGAFSQNHPPPDAAMLAAEQMVQKEHLKAQKKAATATKKRVIDAHGLSTVGLFGVDFDLEDLARAAGADDANT